MYAALPAMIMRRLGRPNIEILLVYIPLAMLCAWLVLWAGQRPEELRKKLGESREERRQRHREIFHRFRHPD
jgi:hypothetical protein